MRYGVSFHSNFFVLALEAREMKKKNGGDVEEVWSLNVARGFNTRHTILSERKW